MPAKSSCTEKEHCVKQVKILIVFSQPRTRAAAAELSRVALFGNEYFRHAAFSWSSFDSIKTRICKLRQSLKTKTPPSSKTVKKQRRKSYPRSSWEFMCLKQLAHLECLQRCPLNMSSPRQHTDNPAVSSWEWKDTQECSTGDSWSCPLDRPTEK